MWKGTAGIIYVIDTNDKERLKGIDSDDYDYGSIYQFDKIIKEEDLSACPILMLCNKQDLPNALRYCNGTEIVLSDTNI